MACEEPSSLALSPNDLKALCARLYPRLKHIASSHNFFWFDVDEASPQPFFDPRNAHCRRKVHKTYPIALLWRFIVSGSPLLDLLILLYRSHEIPCKPLSELAMVHRPQTASDSLEQFDRVLKEYIQRLNDLWRCGRLAEGLEIGSVTSTDIINGALQAFGKLVRSVHMLVQSLEAVNRNLYVLPKSSAQNRCDAIERLKQMEIRHLEVLRTISCGISDFSIGLPPDMLAPESSEKLKVVSSYIEDIADYQMHINVNVLNDECWDHFFGLLDSGRYEKGTGAYQAFSLEYPSLMSLLYRLCEKATEVDVDETVRFLKYLRRPIDHILTYPTILMEIISYTNPTDDPYSFDSLCLVQFRFMVFNAILLECTNTARSTLAVQKIMERAFFWDGPQLQVEELGMLALDDYLKLTLTKTSAREGSPKPFCLSETCGSFAYPVKEWDIGLGLRTNAEFVIFASIPCSTIVSVDDFPLDENRYGIKVISCTEESAQTNITLYCSSLDQHKQWLNELKDICLGTSQDAPLSSKHLHPAPACTDRPLLSPRVKKLHEELNSTRSRSLPSALDPDSSALNFSGGDSLVASPGRLDFRDDALIDRGNSLESIHALNLDRFEIFFGRCAPVTLPDYTGLLVKLSEFPVGHGGFADIWKCKWKNDRDKIPIAVKVLRAIAPEKAEQKERTGKKLHHELRVWQQLHHRNIAPLLGICSDFGPYASMALPWYDNGSLHHFITNNDELSFTSRLKLLVDVISGLAYLHSFRVVHGDLTSMNVLIDKEERACLSDFGLSTIIEDVLGTSFLSSKLGGAVRWAAPEPFDFTNTSMAASGRPQLSTSSDMYSFGGIMFQALSGKLPWFEHQKEAQVIISLSQCEKHSRPEDCPFITDRMWDVVSECWMILPASRPTAADMKSRMLLLYYLSLANPNDIL